jgi:hypothetical protein
VKNDRVFVSGPEAFPSVIRVPQAGRTDGDPDVKGSLVRIDESMMHEGADAGHTTTDAPRSDELQRRIGCGVPALSHSDDATVLGEHPQFPGGVTSRL